MELNTRSPQKPHILLIGAIGLLLAVIVIYFSNTWTVRSARQNTDEAVHTVSDFYLRELAGRRGQVIASYLDGNIQNIYTAVAQLEEQDLSDLFHLMMFQARIERLYELERFAFVDTKGQIYTSFGIRKKYQRVSLSRPAADRSGYFCQGHGGRGHDGSDRGAGQRHFI